MHHATGMISSNNHVETNDLVRDAREDHRQSAIILDGTATGGETEKHTTIAHPDLRDWLLKEESMLGVPTKDAPADSHPDIQAAIGTTSDHSNTKKKLTMEDCFCERYPHRCPINKGSAEWDGWIMTVENGQCLPDSCSCDQFPDTTEPNEVLADLEYTSQGDVYGKVVELEEGGLFDLPSPGARAEDYQYDAQRLLGIHRDDVQPDDQAEPPNQPISSTATNHIPWRLPDCVEWMRNPPPTEFCMEDFPWVGELSEGYVKSKKYRQEGCSCEDRSGLYDGAIRLSQGTEYCEAITRSNPNFTYPPLIIDFSKAGAEASNDLLQQHLSSIAPALPLHEVRIITVTAEMWYSDWTLLEEFFTRVPCLTDVHWSTEGPIPPSIISILAKKEPKVKLHYKLLLDNWSAKEEWYTWLNDGANKDSHVYTEAISSRSAIFNSTNLHSLTADVIYGHEDDFDDMSFVFSILSSCPNIRSLSLTITYVGDDFGGFTPNAFDFLSHPEVKFPPLEILKLSDYAFDERSDGGPEWSYNDGQDWRVIIKEWLWNSADDDDYFPRPVRPEWDNRTNLDAWKDAMNFSHIHTLDLAWRSFTPQALKGLNASVLPSLKHLSLRHGYHAHLDTILAFLNTTANPLQTLNFHNILSQPVNLDTLFEVITSRHSSTLKSFSMTTRDSTHHLAIPQLSYLLSHCPELSNLEIAFPRHPYTLSPRLKFEPFTPLLLAENLSSLTIHFPSPDPIYGTYHNQYVDNINLEKVVAELLDPVRTKVYLEELYSWIRSRKAGNAMEMMEVYVGDWEDRDYTGLGARYWGRVERWECFVEKEGEGVCVNTYTLLEEDSWM
jgi:hypothetical protein